jgi:hypothetical protein
MRVLSPTGVLGSGFMEISFERSIAARPHVIGAADTAGADVHLDWTFDISV